MEKTAAPKTYKDPTLNKIIQEKAAWNRQVSSFINDIIHFKKSMNGWPSKFYKERTRITQPVPIDFASIISKMTGEFQELANQGTSIIREQADFAKNHIKRHSDQTLNKLDQKHETVAPSAPGPDLSQQIGQKLTASVDSDLIKLANDMEFKYELEITASNPISRFVTRLFNPKFGFGEGARIRRLRMTMLDYCAKSYKELKKLHKEIVKSGKGSIVNSHKMMTFIWNYWNAVNRLLNTYKAIRSDTVVNDVGGPIDSDYELKKEQAIEEGRDPNMEPEPEQSSGNTVMTKIISLIKDYQQNVLYFSNDSKMVNLLKDLDSVINKILTAPKNKQIIAIQKSNILSVYQKTLQAINAEWGTSGNSFSEVVSERKSQLSNQPVAKEAQRQLGKIRHQIIPGASSGQRLEIYGFIVQIKKDLDGVMNLLESGFDQDKLAVSINQVNREMVQLRTMVRSLYYSEKPEEASTPFF